MKSDQTNGDAQESDQLHIYKCTVHPTFTGYASIASKIRAYLTWPRKFRHECAQLGVKWPNGLLLTGPPGVGKTSLIQVQPTPAEAFANKQSRDWACEL